MVYVLDKYLTVKEFCHSLSRAVIQLSDCLSENSLVLADSVSKIRLAHLGSALSATLTSDLEEITVLSLFHKITDFYDPEI